MFQVSSPVQSYFILFQQSDWILGYLWVHQGFIQVEGLRKPSPETPTAGRGCSCCSARAPDLTPEAVGSMGPLLKARHQHPTAPYSHLDRSWPRFSWIILDHLGSVKMIMVIFDDPTWPAAEFWTNWDALIPEIEPDAALWKSYKPRSRSQPLSHMWWMTTCQVVQVHFRWSYLVCNLVCMLTFYSQKTSESTRC